MSSALLKILLAKLLTDFMNAGKKKCYRPQKLSAKRFMLWQASKKAIYGSQSYVMSSGSLFQSLLLKTGVKMALESGKIRSTADKKTWESNPQAWAGRISMPPDKDEHKTDRDADRTRRSPWHSHTWVAKKSCWWNADTGAAFFAGVCK